MADGGDRCAQSSDLGVLVGAALSALNVRKERTMLPLPPTTDGPFSCRTAAAAAAAATVVPYFCPGTARATMSRDALLSRG